MLWINYLPQEKTPVYSEKKIFIRKYKSEEHGELADFATGSKFRPYVTTVGLYNDEGELLVVGKLAQPVKMSEETDTTFVVRYDTW